MDKMKNIITRMKKASKMYRGGYMAVYKCKVCAGSLNVIDEQTTIECDYCGIQQSIPRLNNELIRNLFEQANHFRRNNEYDKAKEVYEKILIENPTDPEIYWSILLCDYGVEYVLDEKTNKRIPTVNRAQYTSIFDDENYKKAIEYADGYQKEIYIKDSTIINEIQNKVLEIYQLEDPYDIFISYKETDSYGKRTPDSVIGYDLYRELTKEGYKVFFSRITLEKKLGTEYEPYIFSALNSSKVMVVIGTNKEYFNSIWVKNEWSRFLVLIKQSKGSKVLIPAFKDMNPYELPREFSHLQAQNMSKLGFMQDLIYGIKKIISSSINNDQLKEKILTKQEKYNILMNRANSYLKEEKWNTAIVSFNYLLDINPKDYNAYLGRMLAKLRCKDKKELSFSKFNFENTIEYKKIIQLNNVELIQELNDYLKTIKERNEIDNIDKKHSKIKHLMENKDNVDDLNQALIMLEQLSEFKDVSDEIYECNILIKKLNEKQHTNRLENIYSEALRLAMNGKTTFQFKKAIGLFNTIIDYRDSSQQIVNCEMKIFQLEKSEMVQQKMEFDLRKKKELKTKIITTIIIIVIIVILIIILKYKE